MDARTNPDPCGKTQMWNQGGEKPPGCDALTTDAQHHDPNAVVWKGDGTLPLDQNENQFFLDLRCRIFRANGCHSCFALFPSQTTFSACYPRSHPGVRWKHGTSVKKCFWQLLHTIPDTCSCPVGPMCCIWSAYVTRQMPRPCWRVTVMTHVIPTQGAVVARPHLQTWGSVLLSGTLWPTVNVRMGSPILMTSVHDCG